MIPPIDAREHLGRFLMSLGAMFAHRCEAGEPVAHLQAHAFYLANQVFANARPLVRSA